VIAAFIAGIIGPPLFKYMMVGVIGLAVGGAWAGMAVGIIFRGRRL